MKQIYSELQSRVCINTPYKGKWEKILNEQNIDWVETWNTVHQTTTTLKVKSDIFSQIHLSFYCNYLHQKSDLNVTAMCNLCVCVCVCGGGGGGGNENTLSWNLVLQNNA